MTRKHADRDHLCPPPTARTGCRFVLGPAGEESGYERGDNSSLNAAWARMAVPLLEDEGKDDGDHEDALH